MPGVLEHNFIHVEKIEDVVGLYMKPPDHTFVLSVDEESQFQALDRTQPGLPFKKGRRGTMTLDYKRNGTTTLFAALELLQSKAIRACMKRHRYQEWLKFLRQIDKQTQADLDLHLIVDNYNASWKEGMGIKRNLAGIGGINAPPSQGQRAVDFPDEIG